MASLPESNREERRPQLQRAGSTHSGAGIGGLVLLWTIMMAPVGAFYAYLARRLDAVSIGTSLLALIAFICVAIFAALAVSFEFNVISHDGSGAERRLAHGTRKPESHYLELALAAIVIPLAFSILGAVITWTRLTHATSGSALFLISASIALSNGFSWLFAHFLLKELIARKERSRDGGLYAAFQVARSVKPTGGYAPPVHPALVGLAMISLFIFAFTIPSSLRTGERSQGWDTPSVVAVIFVIALLAFLALGRFHSLASLARRNRISLPGFRKKPDSPGFNWAALMGMGILLLCFLSALLPLNALVDFGQRFRIQPPQTRPELESYSSRAGPVNLAVQWLMSGTSGFLLALIFLALIVAATWLMRRRIKRTRTWQRIIRWATTLWLKLNLWLKRIIYGMAHPAEMPRSHARHKAKRDRFADVFDDPEALKRLSPAQVIMATFHLLLECAGKRGWLEKAHQPPLEVLHTLLKRTRLDADDLTYLTWAYARAAYSPASPPHEEVTLVQQAWTRLKPHLLSAESQETTSTE